MAAPVPNEIPAGLPRPGDVHAAKYRIERVLGVGGMGVVYAATHLHLDEPVALKLIHPECADAVFIARFLREGRAVVKIRSEHVARVLDFGVDDRGKPYLVMEQLTGHDLSSAVGTLPIALAVDYVVQACDALAHAHAIGIVHRDMKPSNLFAAVGPDGVCVKVLDFGIAKTASTEGVPGALSLTRTSGTMGSPLYMSPEQIRAIRDVDLRADIWSLGVVLFELVTGRTPFDGHSLAAVAAAIMVDAPASMRATRGDVPPGLDAIVARCLEKTPEKRFSNVSELARALAQYGEPATSARVDRIARTVAGSAPRLSALSHSTGAVRSADPVPVAPQLSAGPALHHTAASWGGPASGGGAGRRVALVAAGVATTALVLVGVGIALGVSGWRGTNTSRDAASTVASTSAVGSPVSTDTFVSQGDASSDGGEVALVAPTGTPSSGALPSASAAPPALSTRSAPPADVGSARKPVRATPRLPTTRSATPPATPPNPAPPPSSGLVRDRHGG